MIADGLRTLFLVAFAPVLLAQEQSPLPQQIARLSTEARGTVSVSCSLPGTRLDCDLNPHGHAPMQSAFKLPLGVAVLHAVEQGRLSLDQQVGFLPSDVYPGWYSPLQDMYPRANVNVPLRQLVELAVGRSDNAATDILLRLLGGPEATQGYLDTLGLEGLQVRDSERSLHEDEGRQYRNYGEPAAFVKLLRMLADHSPLDAEHTELLLGIMSASPTGPNRLRGLLPQGTVVAHKTGTSGYDKGMAAATVDVGLITLSDGRRLALAVLVTDAHANEAAVEHTIAAIARACYQAAMATKPTAHLHRRVG